MTTRRIRPVGSITRGTTAANRLRRVDAWMLDTLAAELRAARNPLVVDLGYGAAATTTVELFHRLHSAKHHVEVVGIEIDPARVEAAQTLAQPGLSFRLGGFELAGIESTRRPLIVRAFNVLRQYDEADVSAAWSAVTSRLALGGAFIEGTCDEIGRLATWVRLGANGPVTLTFAARLGSLGRPSDLAERLPKALIHRNVPGEPIHDFIRDWDQAWAREAGHATFGSRQRWIAAARSMVGAGWPVPVQPDRWRLGELTVPWSAVAPKAG